MLALTPDSGCDVCFENYTTESLPHILPCGHILCGSCTCKILAEAAKSGERAGCCPFCRDKFDREQLRKMLVDFDDKNDQAGWSESSMVFPSAVGPVGPLGVGELHNAHCDRCGRPIVGARYKCIDCPDWDSCHECFPGVYGIHPHKFVRVREAADYIRPPAGPARPPVHEATCDKCLNKVVGVRYKCTHPNCPDFDLCENCEALPDVHPTTHVMYKIRSARVATAPRPGTSIFCDRCENVILGVRWKCMHPACPDFDLCEICRLRPIPNHPANHPLAQYRTNPIRRTV